jgi:MFS family permease
MDPTTLHENQEAPYPPLGASAYAIAVLMLVGLIVFLDRQILTLLVPPVRQDLHITDSGMAALQGIAFVALYSVAGLPLGWLVDRVSRRNLLLAGLLFWSAMTVACGLATSFAGLFAARLGLGIGAAIYDPAVFSMVADYVSPARRGRAMAAITVGLGLGVGASLIIGGLVIDLIRDKYAIMLPLYGTLTSWHLVFLVVGLPGFLVGLLLLTVAEPVRREAMVARIGPLPAAISISLPGHLRAHGLTFGLTYAAYAGIAFAAYASTIWVPTFLMRSYGATAAQAGYSFGAVISVCTIFGPIAGGVLADRWVRLGMLDGRFRVNLLAIPIFVVGMIAGCGAPNMTLSLAGLSLTIVAGGLALGTAFSAIQELVPNQLRGQAIALYSLTVNLIGLGLGPAAVAAATDHIFHNDAQLARSLILTCLPALVLSGALTLFGLAPYRRTRLAVFASEKP